MQQGDVVMSDSDVSDEEALTLIGGQSVQGYVTDLFTSVITGLQRANELPQGDDYEFYESFRSFPKNMNEYAATLSKLLTKVSETYSRGNVDAWKRDEELRELVDDLLEGIDDDLDTIKSEAAAKVLSTEEKIRKKQLLKAVQAVRPQNNFKVKPDNTTAAFRPFIQNGPNADYFSPDTHPYEKQIKAFKPHPWQLAPPEHNPPVFPDPENVDCEYIDKPKQLDRLAKLLLKEKEFAVDLEHHSMHSFQGFVCLMQVSTRSQDFIIDAIELRSHMWRLHAAFANENIMKVLHGGSSDIEWLQRDFGIYVVNLFDTGAAAQQLAIPHGLGKTLGNFGINLDKRYQTADWRQRPLTADMLKYARLDTHYLLSLVDHLRLRLMAQGARGGIQNPLHHVYDESNQLCLRRYVKPSLQDDEMRLMGKIDEGTRTRHADALKSILRWRDETAREEDESYAAVLHSATCISLAQELPGIDISKSSICRLFTPTPRLLQKHVNRLLEILKEDMIQGQAGQSKAEKVTTTVAEVATEAGWNNEGDDDELWGFGHDENVVKVLRSDPSKLYEAIRAHVEKTTDKREHVHEHFSIHRSEVHKQQAEARSVNIPIPVPTQPAPAAPVPLPPQASLSGGDIISFSANAGTRKQTQPQAVTSLRERESKRPRGAGGEKKAKLPHLEPTPLKDNTPSDVFLKDIGWEVVVSDEPVKGQWNQKKSHGKRGSGSGSAPSGQAQQQGQGGAHNVVNPSPQHAYQYPQQVAHPQHMQSGYSQPLPQQQHGGYSYPFPLHAPWQQHFQPTATAAPRTQFMPPYASTSTYAPPHHDGPFQSRRAPQQ